MHENLIKLLQILCEDENLVKKFRKCSSPEEAYELAQTVVPGYSFDEFKDFMTQRIKNVTCAEDAQLTEEEYQYFMEKMSAENDEELTEDDLNSVSGGRQVQDEDGEFDFLNIVALGACIAAAI